MNITNERYIVCYKCEKTDTDNLMGDDDIIYVVNAENGKNC